MKEHRYHLQGTNLDRSSFAYHSTPKTEDEFFSETSIDFQRAAWLYIQETRIHFLFFCVVMP
jgi:hypothetical protein